MDANRILKEGGYLLCASRAYPRKDEATHRAVLDSNRRWRIDAHVAICGNDTLGVAQWLHEQRIRVIGVPKTVDNDLSETDYCIGFDTAGTGGADPPDRLPTTASAPPPGVGGEAMGRATRLGRSVGGRARGGR